MWDWFFFYPNTFLTDAGPAMDFVLRSTAGWMIKEFAVWIFHFVIIIIFSVFFVSDIYSAIFVFEFWILCRFCLKIDCFHLFSVSHIWVFALMLIFSAKQSKKQRKRDDVACKLWWFFIFIFLPLALGYIQVWTTQKFPDDFRWKGKNIEMFVEMVCHKTWKICVNRPKVEKWFIWNSVWKYLLAVSTG
jgi:hypothetical protein